MLDAAWTIGLVPPSPVLLIDSGVPVLGRSRRWMVFGTVLVLLSVPAALASADVSLTLRLVDEATGAPSAARVRIVDPVEEHFLSPDPSLRTHFTPVVGGYVYAADSLVVTVAEGTVRVVAGRGLSSVPIDTLIQVAGPTEVVLSLRDWIDPRAWGWYGGDPHTHGEHSQGADYPRVEPDEAARVARAEGLDLLHLLDNEAATPGGAALPVSAGATIGWGEEYRADYWGHVVLLGLDELVLGDGYPGCCSITATAWPTLSEILMPAPAPLAILAHPRSTDDPSTSVAWPGTGYAREAAALALAGLVDAVAVGSGSNAPGPWQEEVFLDGLRIGADWAAVGEGDRAMDRFQVPPPGEIRTYAQLDSAYAPGDPGLEEAWRNAVRSGRCYATSGPVITAFTVDGVGMGGTRILAGPASVSVHLALTSQDRWDLLRLYGASGTHVEWAWPAGRTTLDTTMTLAVARDDFFVLEVSGPPSQIPGRMYAPHAVSSAVWVRMGSPWTVDAASARRGADDLRRYWADVYPDRGFPSAVESTVARAQILGAANAYEAMVDDPAGPFDLTAPPDGSLMQVSQFVLRWTSSTSFDGESRFYRLTLADDPGLLSPVLQIPVDSTSYTVQGLAAGVDWYWSVEAIEDGDAPVAATNGPWRFRVDETAVAAPLPVHGLSLRAYAEGDGVMVRWRQAHSAPVRIEIFDLRGRRVYRSEPGPLEAGEHRRRWNGVDDAGHPVARGVYTLRLRVGGEQARARVLLLR